MKAIIVTVYNSENCGSFLQAFALQHYLKSLGLEVAFYKRLSKKTSHEFLPHLKDFAANLLRLKFRKAFRPMWRWWVFQYLATPFRVVDKKNGFYNDADLVVLGSDTLWNFESDYFLSKKDVYTGKNFKNKQVITYAVSAANTTEELFHIATQDNVLNQIRAFLVRDTHTKDLLIKEGITDVEIVCDPTLLVDKRAFSGLIKPTQRILKKYILLYYFYSIPDDLQQSIIRFAKKHSLKIVSLNDYRDWCDYNILIDPRNLITYYNSASFVVTNTFHGTAFSLIYSVPFAVYDVGLIKVRELLSTYCQQNRLIKDAASLDTVLNIPFSSETEKIVQHVRSSSSKLFNDSINNCLNLSNSAIIS